MGFGYLEGNCGKCGEKTREPSNAFAYGSPIRFCPKCKQEYLDRRWREVAVQGFDPKSTSVAYYAKAFLILFAITVLSGGWLYYTMHFKGYYYTMVVAIVIVCAIACVACLGLMVWIALGFAAKSNAKYLAESERRMRNPEYVKKLQACGYVIPAKYLAEVMGQAQE